MLLSAQGCRNSKEDEDLGDAVECMEMADILHRLLALPSPHNLGVCGEDTVYLNIKRRDTRHLSMLAAMSIVRKMVTVTIEIVRLSRFPGASTSGIVGNSTAKTE